MTQYFLQLLSGEGFNAFVSPVGVMQMYGEWMYEFSSPLK